MGMFDYVDFEMDCPGCGKKVNGFQSKDGECYLGWIKPMDVNNFYDACNNCGAWIEFNRVKPTNLNDFEMTFTPKEPLSQQASEGKP